MSERHCMKICEGVNLSYVKDQKFKMSRLSFNMFLPLNKETASVNALVSAILDRSCSKYPDFALFNKRLEELYGASIYSSVDKIGESQLITVSAVCVSNDVTFDETDVVSDVAELLCETIFNPRLDGEKFYDEDVIQAKRQIKEYINSEYNDKKVYSRIRCEELMCQNEKFGVNKYGREEDIEDVTSEDIFNAWKRALQSSKIEIMLLGNLDHTVIYDMFCDKFSQVGRKNIVDCRTDVISDVPKVRQFSDSLDVVQCKLVMGFRTKYSASEYNVFPVILMTAILGGTPNSKLFLNVREELSLCYYCHAFYNKNKGIMMIESGVEKDNLNKAKEEILNQFEKVKSGDFTDSELNDTRLYLIQSIEKIEDKLSDMDHWYVSQTLSKKVNTPQEAMQCLKDVTKEQVIEAAGSVVLDTVYTLVGNGGNSDEA